MAKGKNKKRKWERPKIYWFGGEIPGTWLTRMYPYLPQRPARNLAALWAIQAGLVIAGILAAIIVAIIDRSAVVLILGLFLTPFALVLILQVFVAIPKEEYDQQEEELKNRRSKEERKKKLPKRRKDYQ
ncbi:hypothetical protein ACFLZW_02625 [Chloroflexota bacterium]